MSDNSTTDPKPLLTDSSIGSDLRAVLDAGTMHEPSRSDLSKLGVRLAAALPPGTLPPSTGNGGGDGGGGAGGDVAPPLLATAAKATLAITLGSAIAIGAIKIFGGPTEHTKPPAHVETTPPRIASQPVATQLEGPPLDFSDAAAAAAAAANPSGQSSTQPFGVPEPVLITRAHDELLRGQPQRALLITNAHLRSYPNGALSQEREVIAIEALVALNRKDEAKARAAAFHTAYPGSAHGERLDRLVQ